MRMNDWKNRLRIGLVILAIGATNTMAADGRPGDVVEGDPVKIVRDGTMQRMFVSVAAAKEATTFETRLIDLRRAAEADWPKFFAQLLLRHAERLEEEGEVKSKAFAGRVLHALQPTRETAMEALAPHLDNESPVIAGFASELLRSLEDKSVDRESDFTGYRGIAEADYRAERATRASLVRRMYASDAGQAMTSLMRAYQVRDLEEIRTIRLGERHVERVLWKRQHGIEVTADELKAATDAMEAFARHERWYVRLYVAKMGWGTSGLVTQAQMESLTRDRHWLVRETAQGN